MRLLTAGEIQKMDKKTIETFGLPGRLLMENAGRGAVQTFLKYVYRGDKKSVGIAAGKGNNGGDGFVMARYLGQKGIKSTVFLLCARDGIKGDARTNLDLLDAMDVDVIEIPDAKTLETRMSLIKHQNYWIDAILGTGLKSEVRGFYKTIISLINSLNRPVFSVDIPSGVDSDTGIEQGIAIKAHTTATFAFAKTGHLLFPGAKLTGRLQIVEIGIPPFISQKIGSKRELITPEYIQRCMPDKNLDAHKGSNGHVLVIAGSTGKTGAAAMCATSAMRSGAGLVTLGVPKTLNPILESQVIEAMTVPLSESTPGNLGIGAFEQIKKLEKGKSVIALGPGLGTAKQTKQLVHKIISSTTVPLVIDADGLNALSDDMAILKTVSRPMVLTPHPGEMERLSGLSIPEILKDRVGCATHFATKYNVHLVLKGARTIVAHPDGSVFINPTGNPGMASGGMGDVLTGMISGYISQGFPIEKAIHSAVFIHGAAADTLQEKTGPFGYLATEVMNIIPEQIARLLAGKIKIEKIHHDALAYDP